MSNVNYRIAARIPFQQRNKNRVRRLVVRCRSVRHNGPYLRGTFVLTTLFRSASPVSLVKYARVLQSALTRQLPDGYVKIRIHSNAFYITCTRGCIEVVRASG